MSQTELYNRPLSAIIGRLFIGGLFLNGIVPVIIYIAGRHVFPLIDEIPVIIGNLLILVVFLGSFILIASLAGSILFAGSDPLDKRRWVRFARGEFLGFSIGAVAVFMIFNKSLVINFGNSFSPSMILTIALSATPIGFVVGLINILKNDRSDRTDAQCELPDQRAVEPLIQRLNDMNPDARIYAAKRLGALRDPRAVEPVILALANRNHEHMVRMAFIQMLGQLGDSRAVEPLAEITREKNNELRIAAIRSLGEIGDPQAVNALTALLQDKNSGVRKTAENALGKLANAAGS